MKGFVMTNVQFILKYYQNVVAIYVIGAIINLMSFKIRTYLQSLMLTRIIALYPMLSIPCLDHSLAGGFAVPTSQLYAKCHSKECSYRYR